MPPSFAIQAVPAFTDNYIWLVRDDRHDVTAVVDPGDAAPVLDALNREGWALDAIFLTHHHSDHVGGVDALRRRFPACQVHGHAADRARLPPLTHVVHDGDSFTWGGRAWHVTAVPGHTRGHVAYHVPEESCLFVGDTLFSLGCGRLFEGTPAQMWTSLCRLRSVDGATRVYAAHEYTEANARFARTVDPDNAALAAMARDVAAERAAGRPTLPTLMAREAACNPFLRCDDPALKARHGFADQGDVPMFAFLRAWKDRF